MSRVREAAVEIIHQAISAGAGYATLDEIHSALKKHELTIDETQSKRLLAQLGFIRTPYGYEERI